MSHLGILAAGLAVTLFTGATAFALGPEVPLANQSAESGAASDDGLAATFIPGWATSGVPTVVRYGTSGPFPVRTVEVPGLNDQLFVGGPAPGLATLIQTAVIPEEALSVIDQGNGAVFASARLGGWQSDSDSSRVVVEVLDEHGGILASVIVGPVTAADRGGATVLMKLYQSMAAPIGSRSVIVRLELYGVDGAYNNALADDIHVRIEFPDPVLPTTWGRIKLGEWSANGASL